MVTGKFTDEVNWGQSLYHFYLNIYYYTSFLLKDLPLASGFILSSGLFAFTCQHSSEVKLSSADRDWTMRASVVGDVVNGADKWIWMLFPTQPLTHSQACPLVEQKKEPEKDGKKESTNKHNSFSSPSVNFPLLQWKWIRKCWLNEFC